MSNKVNKAIQFLRKIKILIARPALAIVRKELSEPIYIMMAFFDQVCVTFLYQKNESIQCIVYLAITGTIIGT